MDNLEHEKSSSSPNGNTLSIEAIPPWAWVNMEARHYIVSGRVQGVGFRWFVHRHAQLLNIEGWVKNCYDSTVEILAQGCMENLDELEFLLKKGPPGASVSELRRETVQPEHYCTGFQIMY